MANTSNIARTGTNSGALKELKEPSLKKVHFSEYSPSKISSKSTLNKERKVKSNVRNVKFTGLSYSQASQLEQSQPVGGQKGRLKDSSSTKAHLTNIKNNGFRKLMKKSKIHTKPILRIHGYNGMKSQRNDKGEGFGGYPAKSSARKRKEVGGGGTKKLISQIQNRLQKMKK